MVGAYTGEKWRNIRSAAMARDDRRCQSCGRRDRLHAHHIRPVREFDSEEDAHYLDNLAILCKRCHKIWEGRDARPRLADADRGHTIPGIVGELVSDILWRHCLPAALPEILSRHVAGDSAVCSKCFGILQGTPQFTAMKPFRETLRAVAFRERTLPSADPEDYTTPPVENYCDTCAEEYHTSWETFFGECQKPIRDKRADLLRRIFGEVWDPTRHLIPMYHGKEYGQLITKADQSHPVTMALAYAKEHDLPTSQLSGFSAHMAVTDREVREPEPPDAKENLSYEEWYRIARDNPDDPRLEDSEVCW